MNIPRYPQGYLTDLKNCCEHRAPPGPPGGEGDIPLALETLVTRPTCRKTRAKTRVTEALPEVVREEAVEQRVDGGVDGENHDS